MRKGGKAFHIRCVALMKGQKRQAQALFGIAEWVLLGRSKRTGY